MLHFGEQLSSAVCRAKHAHYLLIAGDKPGESSRQKHRVLVEIEDVSSKEKTLNHRNAEDQQDLPTVLMVLLHNQHQKTKRKFWMNELVSRNTYGPQAAG